MPTVKAMSDAYEAFAKRTMVTKAQGRMIDYVGIDNKTGRYLAVDPATMKRCLRRRRFL